MTKHIVDLQVPQMVLVVKNLSANAGDVGSLSGSGNPLEEGMAIHSSIFAWGISWTEEPGGLQSTGSQRVRLDQSDLARMHWHTWLIDNVVLASGVQQSDSVIHRDISILRQILFHCRLL